MDSSFFSDNRRRLEDRLGTGIVVLAAHNQMQRNNDMAFPFEQEANFWYLTGIEAPDWHLVIDAGNHKSWLVAPHVSDTHQVFEGSLSAEEAIKLSGIQTVIPEADETTLLHDLAKKHPLAYTLGEHPHKAHFDFVENPAGRQLRLALERTFESVRDCRKELATLRAIKQSVEIQAMKKAIAITASAFQKVKYQLADYKHEYEVEAQFDYVFKQQGVGHAYDPIVAAGKNACTLHYTANNAKLRQHQLVLMDVGARYRSYAADITRAYSFGSPTKRQTELYEATLDAHKEIIRLLKPGLAVMEYQQAVDVIMKRALVSVGLLQDENDEKYRQYFPHAVSHGLGIDTHDALGNPRAFKPGMVLTVEPGIYVPEEGIGIRIEDDILITKTGHTNLQSRAWNRHT